MTAEAAGRLRRLSRRLSTKSGLLQVLALVFALALIVALWLFSGTIAGLKSLGYPGIFFISLASSASVLVPAPGLLSICGVSLVLNPILVGLLAGIGEAMGEATGYAVGFGGHGILQGHKFYAKAHDWIERRGTLLIFAASLIPNPIFDVVGVAAGAARFPLLRFLLAVWAGKTLKDLMVAYACSQAAQLLPLFD